MSPGVTTFLTATGGGVECPFVAERGALARPIEEL
jgi:hypothetical protein